MRNRYLSDGFRSELVFVIAHIMFDPRTIDHRDRGSLRSAHRHAGRDLATEVIGGDVDSLDAPRGLTRIQPFFYAQRQKAARVHPGADAGIWRADSFARLRLENRAGCPVNFSAAGER